VSIDIGPAGESDLDAVAALHTTSFDTGWSADTFAELLSSAGVYLWQARDGAVLSGFVLARIVADEAEILTIAVAEPVRGQRIGERLMEQVVIGALAQGGVALFLEVAEDNQSAISLYDRMGFSEVGRRPAYYQRKTGPIAALTMRLALSEAAVVKHL
tara:strand:+ start:11398 stop:11871 length:474 start_codon:yes stop_codon:yes gene_type:complete